MAADLSDIQTVYHDVVVKAFFSKPVRELKDEDFTLTDSHGARVKAQVGQIGDGVWGLFPDVIFLRPGERYTARLKNGICDLAANCTGADVMWNFQIASNANLATGDTSIAMGFQGGQGKSIQLRRGERK